MRVQKCYTTLSTNEKRKKVSKEIIKKILIQRSRYNGHIHTDIQRRATLAG